MVDIVIGWDVYELVRRVAARVSFFPFQNRKNTHSLITRAKKRFLVLFLK